MKISISENCTVCGACSEVCPSNVISIQNEIPTLTSVSCIKCGHCESVCPQNAITNDILNHYNVKELEQNFTLDSESAELFLRSRRSIRCFSDEPIEKKKIEKLVNIGRYAQTGSNSQSVSYIVVSSSQILNSIKKLTLNYYMQQKEPVFKSLYKRFLTADKDTIFRGAPILIIALTPKDNPYTFSNARFALTYIELFAPSLGLGTCWAGFFERYTNTDSDELRALLNIPDGSVISATLLCGVPKYKYNRLPDRDKLNLEWR